MTRTGWRERLHEIVFEADTPAGRWFDIGLMVAILVSVAAVILETVEPVAREYGGLLRGLEWGFTVIFTVEYLVRLVVVRHWWRYARSFFGVVDLISILPLYLSILLLGAHPLIVVRVLRLLRIFRVFKMARFLGEANVLRTALGQSLPKVVVFLGTVLSLVVIIGAVMHVVESGNPGFENLPKSMYWTIVTLTTVGYGDIVPATVLGRFLAALVMVMGFGIIAVPTGIVSAELIEQARRLGPPSTQVCPECQREGHTADARFCKYCGAEL